jgi:hypothetical protein
MTITRKKSRAARITKKKSQAKSQSQSLVMSVSEAGAKLGMSRSAAYRSVERGEIPVIRFKHMIRVPVVRLERMLSGDK